MSATVQEGSIIGQPMKRIEGDKKVTGATRYVDDLQMPRSTGSTRARRWQCRGS